MKHQSKRPDQASRLYEEARDELFSHLLRSRIADAEPERQRVWVTDTLEWRPEARLAQPPNVMRDSAASAPCCM